MPLVKALRVSFMKLGGTVELNRKASPVPVTISTWPIYNGLDSLMDGATPFWTAQSV